jgi:hypothetical protein
MQKIEYCFFKVVIFSLILMSNGNSLLSQTYVNPGAEWLFRNAVSGGNYTRAMRWKYEEDISIDTLSYQKISVQSKNLWYDGGPIGIINQDPFLFRSSGDSLFISEIDGSNENLLYDFTPIVGNSWDVTPLVNWHIVEPTSPLLIETIAFGDTIINGFTVNWIEVVNNNSDSLVFSGRIYNHFGKEQVFPFWFDGVLDAAPILWRCYRDDLLGEIEFSPCFDFETLGINDFEEFDISIKPKYLAKKIEISLRNKNSIEVISVTDLSGKLIINNSEIKTDFIEFNQTPGIYIITLKLNNLTYSEKFYWSDK